MTVPAFAIDLGSGTTTDDPVDDSVVDDPVVDEPQDKPVVEGGLKDGKLNFAYTGSTMTEDDVILNLSLPSATTGQIILNPYKLKYVDPTDDSQTVDDQVVTSGYNYIENRSNFEVQVDWSVTGTKTSDVVFTHLWHSNRKPGQTACHDQRGQGSDY